jgi:hypothetical protein
MDVKINNTEIEIPTEIATWGDLLDWIETDHLKSGQCITHVYLGANEACNYRTRSVCDQELGGFTNISVVTGDFDKVVHESLVELERELVNTIAVCQDVVRLFEKRQEVEAYNRLAQLLQSMSLFFAIFSQDLGWVQPADAEIAREEFSAALERALAELVTAQESRHWVAVCDVLEFAITPILESWQKMVTRTSEYIN